MSLKNLFLPVIFLLVNSFSSFSLSHRQFPTNQNDTAGIKKPAVIISEMDQNRIMLLDATLELNEALLAGVQASLDTLNVPVKNNPGKNDTIEKLRLMKRERERKEMKSYLDYMKDSLTADCVKIKKEKVSIQTQLGLIVAQKKESENLAGKKQNDDIKNTVARNETPVSKKGKSNPDETILAKAKQSGQADTAHIRNLADKNKKIPDVAVKKEKKHSKHNKKVKSVPTETIFAMNDKRSASNKPVEKIKTVATTDTSARSKQLQLVKADTLEKRRPEVDSNKLTVLVSPDADIAMRIKSRYLTTYAQKAIVEKNYPKAQEYLSSSIEFWKDNYEAWFTKAEMEEKNGNLDKAMEAYQRCYRIDSSKPKLFYNMALLNLQSQDRGKALCNLNKAIVLDANYINAYMKRASVYNDTANYKAAVADYDNILKFNRNYYNAYKGRGISKLMQRNFKGAIDDFTRYLIYDQSDAEVYYYRGLAKISNNEWLDGCLELSMSASMGYTAAAVAQKKNCQ